MTANRRLSKTHVFRAIGKDGEELFYGSAKNFDDFCQNVTFELKFSAARYQNWLDGDCKVQEQLWDGWVTK